MRWLLLVPAVAMVLACQGSVRGFKQLSSCQFPEGAVVAK